MVVETVSGGTVDRHTLFSMNAGGDVTVSGPGQAFALPKGYESFPVGVINTCCCVDNIVPGSEEIDIGSGVCVDPSGLVLTAGHCASSQLGCTRTVRFAHGDSGSSSDSSSTFTATCVKLSLDYDLALFQLPPPKTTPSYAFAKVAATTPNAKTKLVCVGQQGKRAETAVEATFGKVVSRARDPLKPQLEEGGCSDS